MKNYYIPPEGFYIGSYEIKFYGLIIATAMMIAVMLGCKLAKKRGIKSDDILLLALILLPCAVLGTRLYYCFFYEHNYSLVEIFDFRQGGLAIYGGVIGGFIGIVIFSLIKRDWKLIASLCDIAVPCVILGQCMGRWGNFFNQEAYGNIITNPNFQWFPFGVFIEDENAWFQATFFYESLWNFVGLFVLLVTYYRTNKIGTTTAMYFIWYGIGRALIEGLRSDSLYIANTTIRVSQLVSVVLVFVGLVILAINITKTIKEKRQQKN